MSVLHCPKQVITIWVNAILFQVPIRCICTWNSIALTHQNMKLKKKKKNLVVCQETELWRRVIFELVENLQKENKV